MRLEKIRLAGFKSFVDPTTVFFPSNLVGVVGPNGCGKSNVIDAVRWVMGESSAKMLRGESMADVIFNGSAGRKPVGVASIELVFDNADGGAGGEYARFNQISVKRQVGRDGQSGYFLNGTRCRRRDIQDLFLGTGLGPRSYAIIEQGMISRLIEARPEDLRLFLEEAAGISKYKERRRETEQRMRHTRENLDRLDDLREEVGKQLLHLERQAATAEQYRRLKVEERQLDRALKALRWRALDGELQEQDRRLAAGETAAAANLARLRRLEADIEQSRARHVAASATFNEAQGRFYAVGAEIARAEQAIQFANEARGHREGELLRIEQELGDTERLLENDQDRLETIAAELERDEPDLRHAEEALAAALAAVGLAETGLRDWEQIWDACNQEAAQPTAEAQGVRARINALEQRLARERERLGRLEAERDRLLQADLSEEITDAGADEGEQAEALAEAQARAEDCHARLAIHEDAWRDLQRTLDGIRTERQQTQGRLASLAALHEAALADADPELARWLEAHGLAQAPRLADRLAVEPGWEDAVESVLGTRLRALGTPAWPDDGPAAWSADGSAGAALPPGLCLCEIDPAPAPDQAADARPAADTLTDRVRSTWPLADWLDPVRPVASLAAALAGRATLAPGQRLVTPEGVEVGRHWLRTPEPATDGVGVLRRLEDIRALEAALASLHDRENAALQREADLLAARTQTGQQRDAAEREVVAHARDLADLRARLAQLRARQDAGQERLRALERDAEELAGQLADDEEESIEQRERLHALLEEMERLAIRRETLAGERAGLRERLDAARVEERDCRDRAQALRVSLEANRAAAAAAQRHLDRLDAQQELLSERRADLLDELEAAVEPLAEQRARLDAQLGQRIEAESALNAARAQLESIDAEIREADRERQRLELDQRAEQQTLDALKLERQERLVRRQTLEEQLAEAETTAEAVLRDLEPLATEAHCQEQLTRVVNRIQRLGAINLAAIEEYQEQSQRKVYLDAQHDDIARSLDTLEQAIRKIDRETRQRFKDTFDRVDHGFQQLFPRLFGGGHAYLALTDEDLLETGVSVMARPPGKRNSTIHQLSGGEKALTAVAMVFAIFELNPAPFCMLDEVDAPLDEANVGRFCELVRSMSDRVQFIFISHNKVTMEIADHLLGVTMQEPGVSRLVAVDVEAAVRLAEAGG